MTAKNHLKSVVYISLSILFSFIFIEFVMIVAEPWLFKSTMMYDPDIGFKVRPHYGGTNRFGFNDREHSLKKEPGVYRILILGDSFNWSCGKDGNYTALLQKKFDQQSHERKIEIINAGFPMTNPAEELLILKKFGLSYDPDLDRKSVV